MEWTESAQTPKHIVCKEKDGMFQIFLNRPPTNALNLEMIEELNAAVANLMYRTDLKLITFLPSGENFCQGSDHAQKYGEQKNRRQRSGVDLEPEKQKEDRGKQIPQWGEQVVSQLGNGFGERDPNEKCSNRRGYLQTLC